MLRRRESDEPRHGSHLSRNQRACARHVAARIRIRTHEYAPIQSIVSVIAEGGKLTSDTALIQTTAIKVLQSVLNCRLAYGVGSGLAARIAGEVIGADADMPDMGTEEFLSCLSRAALEAEAGRHRVLPRGRVKDTRTALIDEVRETGLVLPIAHFALTEQECSDFAMKGSRYAYDGENEDDETVVASITRENADLDNDDGDGGHDTAAPEVDAVDCAAGGHEARV
jgi:ParB family transcriptional regulator, chromosome partitioning protein